MHKHLADQHGEEDPIRFNLQRNPAFASPLPPRTYASDPPVVVNPTMFDEVLRYSLAMRRAVEASMEARHRALQQTVTGGFNLTPGAPSVSHATRDSTNPSFSRRSDDMRGTPPILSCPSSSSSTRLPRTSAYLPAGAPSSTMYRSSGLTRPAGLTPSLSTASCPTSSLPPANEMWAALDESGKYVYITPAEFEEYYSRGS